MDAVAPGGLAADTVEMLLAWVLLGSYALALGRLVGRRGRFAAALLAAAAAVVLVIRSSSWEAGVVMVALVPLCVGLFAGFAWAVWRLTGIRARDVAAEVSPSPDTAVSMRRVRGRFSAWLLRV